MSIATVLGEVPVKDLGVTLTHEHLSIEFNKIFVQPPQQLKEFLDQSLSLKNLGFVRQYPYSCSSNLTFKGEEVENAVLDDLKLYKKFGGTTILENTTYGIGRDNQLIIRLSRESGVNVIAGTGHYVDFVQGEGVRAQSVEELYKTMKTDLVDGCIGCPEFKCGFIGEVGSSWPITDFERRCIMATGEAQAELGSSVSFHPGRNPKAPAEILRMYSEAGGRLEKAVMSHLERTLLDREQILEFAELGSYCQFDLFGTEVSFYQLAPSVDMVSDAQRISYVMALVEQGFLNKILLSHDIHTKHRLINFGGHGYSHILNNVAPRLASKLSKEMVQQILATNPQSWLTKQL